MKLQQAASIVGKLGGRPKSIFTTIRKGYYGGGFDNWILLTGSWRDVGIWIDTDFWIDM